MKTKNADHYCFLDRTDIKRQPESWKETVVVPDEDYPIPAHNIKRNQVAPGRTKTCKFTITIYFIIEKLHYIRVIVL